MTLNVGFIGPGIMGRPMMLNLLKVWLRQKDMRIVMETAHQLGVVLPAASMVTQHLNALMGTGDTPLDSAAIVKVIARMSGMEEN